MIVVLGYPALKRDRNRSAERSVLFSGIIASDPQHCAGMWGATTSYDTVLADCSSRRGLSGSPVVAPRRGLLFGLTIMGSPSRPPRVVGVNTGRIEPKRTDFEDYRTSRGVRRSCICCARPSQHWGSERVLNCEPTPAGHQVTTSRSFAIKSHSYEGIYTSIVVTINGSNTALIKSFPPICSMIARSMSTVSAN